jgi:hypothetical protein
MDKTVQKFKKSANEKKAEIKMEVKQLKTALDKSINTFQEEMDDSN